MSFFSRVLTTFYKFFLFFYNTFPIFNFPTNLAQKTTLAQKLPFFGIKKQIILQILSKKDVFRQKFKIGALF